MLCRINILSTDNLQFNLKNVFFSLNKPHAAPYERSISQGIRKLDQKIISHFPLTLFLSHKREEFKQFGLDRVH
jgi:hypothetical protein